MSEINLCIYESQVEDLLAIPKHNVHATKNCTVENRSKPNIKNDCLLYYPAFDNHLGYCDFPTIEKYQSEDKELQQALHTNPILFLQEIGNCKLVCACVDDDNWKIVLTNSLLPKIIKWYHEFLMHSKGQEKLFKTIARTFTHLNLKQTLYDYVKGCEICKRMKKGHRQYGQLAPRIAISAPWEEVYVDCIGNW